MKITMKRIAEECGVSVATVSHVINGTKHISEEKYRKITEVINKYHYVPHFSAKNLRQQRTKTAGLIVPSFPDSYVTGYINGIGNRARELGYSLLFINTNEDSDYERETVNLLHSNMVDGIILSPTSTHNDYLQPYIDKNFPIVLLSRHDPKLTSLPWVTADDYQAGYDATLHLINHGHERIGVIYAVPDISPTINRVEGYKAALSEYNISYNEDYLAKGFATVEGGEKAVISLLKEQENLTALFILSDLMTIGAVAACKKLGLKIGEDIAIIGFGDFDSAKILDPPITNISVSPDIIGKTAFDLLMNKINNPKYNRHIQLPSSLVVRKSCGC
ncbi:LacI family DNA-binding transcriptional regulator [Bacillus sp. NSP9.1]|uniref:LacI family DNA-binding transcriptional regulator n=1 Tax=Bacillus sp. NSP9.1 TaxID=1071078 RepID=UPI0003F57CEE|nr:LacI family DNA-binding transcriptional regulator [Bacillus sp. NSP9.1]QHZ48469.1 LacI family transcriptional regulator [Bacillus sp. NSP9.1]